MYCKEASFSSIIFPYALQNFLRMETVFCLHCSAKLTKQADVGEVPVPIEAINLATGRCCVFSS